MRSACAHVSFAVCAGQGAEVEAMLRAFDAMRRGHEGMHADTFNDEGTYKNRLNEVRACCQSARGRIRVMFPVAVGVPACCQWGRRGAELAGAGRCWTSRRASLRSRP